MHDVPWLRRGPGDTPSDGGCIMQIVDWVTTTGWTDQPRCVHPHIRAIAIVYNDRAEDNERQKLLDLIPRMRDTNSSDVMLSAKLEAVIETFNERWHGPNWREDPWLSEYGLREVWNLLVELIDTANEHLGRTEHPEVDLTEVCAVMAGN